MKLTQLIIVFVVITVCLFGIFTVTHASETNGTIDATSKYAWGENIGWINFSPTGGGLQITDNFVSGYAWSATSGWINFSATSSGQSVTNNCDGVLSGSAWSSTKGWINMSGVVINSSGVFTGIAGSSSTPAGRVNFDCAECQVKTDWRHCSDRAQPGGGSGSNPSTPTQTGGGSTAPVITTSPEGNGQTSADGSQLGTSCIDIVKDGVVDIFDFNALVVNWGDTTPGNVADTNGDNVVDIFDFNSVMVCWTRNNN